MTKEYLTELEVDKIESFCKDEAMYEAVKKVLFAVLYHDGVVTKGEKVDVKNGAFSLIANAYSENKDISNEELGQQLRAKFEGVHTIHEGFTQLKTIKRGAEQVESPYNEAI